MTQISHIQTVYYYVLVNDVCIRKPLAFTLHSMRSLKKSMLRENVMTKTFAFS